VMLLLGAPGTELCMAIPTSAMLKTTIPAAVGRYPLATPTAATELDIGAYAYSTGNGVISVDSVGPRVITGRVDADFTTIGASAAVSGTFRATSCGYTGQDVFAIETCPLPLPTLTTSSPDVYAVSPAGRAVVAITETTFQVFARQESAGTCSYALDTAYGQGGTVSLATKYSLTVWDESERLYVFTKYGETAPTVPASLYRVTPANPLVSCSYSTLPFGSSSYWNAPQYAMVLPDGSAAYAFWSLLGEARLDLSDANLAASNPPCVAAAPPGAMSGLRQYTNALSGDNQGLFFTEDVGGVLRAVETDFALNQKFVFGGTASGGGESGLASVTFLARCPQGFCAADPAAMRIFSADGQLDEMLQFAGAFGGPTTALSLTDSGDGSVAWLRLIGPPYTGTQGTDQVAKLTGL